MGADIDEIEILPVQEVAGDDDAEEDDDDEEEEVIRCDDGEDEVLRPDNGVRTKQCLDLSVKVTRATRNVKMEQPTQRSGSITGNVVATSIFCSCIAGNRVRRIENQLKVLIELQWIQKVRSSKSARKRGNHQELFKKLEMRKKKVFMRLN